MAKYKDESGVTYGRLNKTLTTLGFVRKETEDFTAYREAEHGALIVLPNMKSDSAVGEPHLVTVRNTIAGKGVATVDVFETLLVGGGVEHRVSKLKAQAPRLRHARLTLRKPRSKTLKPKAIKSGQQSTQIEIETDGRKATKKKHS